jgi:hypothetical protein
MERQTMKMTDKEKRLLGLFKDFESERNRDDLIYQAETMIRAQEALKADYGLVGPDAPLFNGAGVLQSPSYALPGPGPVMEAQA